MFAVWKIIGKLEVDDHDEHEKPGDEPPGDDKDT